MRKNETSRHPTCSGYQETSKDTQMHSQRAQMEPKGSPRHPKGTQKVAKGSQMEPKGPPRDSKGTARDPKGTPKASQRTQRHPKDFQKEHPEEVQDPGTPICYPFGGFLYPSRAVCEVLTSTKTCLSKGTGSALKEERCQSMFSTITSN